MAACDEFVGRHLFLLGRFQEPVEGFVVVFGCAVSPSVTFSDDQLGFGMSEFSGLEEPLECLFRLVSVAAVLPTGECGAGVVDAVDFVSGFFDVVNVCSLNRDVGQDDAEQDGESSGKPHGSIVSIKDCKSSGQGFFRVGGLRFGGAMFVREYAFSELFLHDEWVSV